MASEPVFRRADGVVSAAVDGDVVLMAPTDGRCFALRGSAEAVWDLLATDHSVDALVAALTERFEVDPIRCAADVTSLLAEMADAGVIEQDPGVAD